MSHTGALPCLSNLWGEMKGTLRFVIGVGIEYCSLGYCRPYNGFM